jgi:hypothetical protein
MPGLGLTDCGVFPENRSNSLATAASVAFVTGGIFVAIDDFSPVETLEFRH